MEHRYSMRRRCEVEALVDFPRGGVAPARVRDVSASGLFLETAARLPRHAVLHVAFSLGAGAERHDFLLAASVVRQDASGIGVVFHDAPDRSLAILQQRLQACACAARAAPAPALGGCDERAA